MNGRALIALAWLALAPSATAQQVQVIEHELASNSHNSLAQVDDDTFALAYAGPTSLGFLKTFTISADGTTISQIQSLEHARAGSHNSMVQVDGNTFALAYAGAPALNGFLKTFTISADGTTITEVQSIEHDTRAVENSLVHVGGNVFALAYAGQDNDGFLKTFTISADGTSISQVQSVEHDVELGRYNSLVQVDADTVALAYTGPGDDGFLKTFTIGAGGTTITEVQSVEHDPLAGTYNSLVQVDGNTFVLAYAGFDADGVLKTFEISADGSTITQVRFSEHDPIAGTHNSLIRTHPHTFLLAYLGGFGDGILKRFAISPAGTEINEIQSLEHDGTSGTHNSLVQVDTDTVALAYSGAASDGFLKTFGILPAVGVAVTDATVVEGSGGGTTEFLVPVSVTSTVTASSVIFEVNEASATAGSDYTDPGGVLVQFAEGGPTTQTVAVQIAADDTVEADETVTFGLYSSAGAVITRVRATGTILNDDTATVTITGVTTVEGDAGTTAVDFVATLDNPVQGGFQLPYTTNDGTATVADGDYTDNDGTLTFAGTSGETHDITVEISGDLTPEPDEAITVALGAFSSLGLGIDPGDLLTSGAPATGSIRNDDGVLTISDTSGNEGADATTSEISLPVCLDRAVVQTASAELATADDTATGGSDYVPFSGLVLTFSPGGSLCQDVAITILGDDINEGDESFFVRITAGGDVPAMSARQAKTGPRSPLGISERVVTVGDAEAVVTIVDDDQSEGSTFSATKTVSGHAAVGEQITYTLVITNLGPGDQMDNPGDEMVDILPPELLLLSAIADLGTATADTGANTVTWNGALAASASVTVTITAEVLGTGAGAAIVNQATVFFDTVNDGTNDGQVLTDDPDVAGPEDPTVLNGLSILAIPTLDMWGFLLLLAGLGAVAVWRIRS